MKKYFIGISIIIITLAGGYYFYQSANTASAPTAAISSDAIFASRIADLAGVRQPLAQWRGKVLVVNFWATWCPPCRKEIPDFIKLQQQYGAQGLQFIGIALDERANVQSFADEVGINYPILIGDLEAMVLAKNSGNRLGGLPYTVIIDQKGKIIATETGELNTAKLTAIITPLLK
ncbi:MAG: TlpA family protein disulfide reductase [Sulfuriferula sp.]|nr:TlpA family protein disulfide reductase [Sulfuriferula sp.]